MKLVGTVLLLTLPALVFMHFYDLPMHGFVVGMLALVAAWLGGELFVRRQVQTMTRTAKKIADGDLEARTGLPVSEDELGQLATILDRMTESLQQRNAERSRTERVLLNRALEQTVVAALGQFALTTNDLEGLLNQAVILVSQTLDVEFVAVFKRLPDRQLLLQTGTGWNPDHLGHDEAARQQRHPIRLHAQFRRTGDFAGCQKGNPVCRLAVSDRARRGQRRDHRHPHAR